MELAGLIHSMVATVLAHAHGLTAARLGGADIDLAIAAATAAVVPARVLLFCIQLATHVLSPATR